VVRATEEDLRRAWRDDGVIEQFMERRARESRTAHSTLAPGGAWWSGLEVRAPVPSALQHHVERLRWAPEQIVIGKREDARESA
jgi:hypothetical protein